MRIRISRAGHKVGRPTLLLLSVLVLSVAPLAGAANAQVKARGTATASTSTAVSGPGNTTTAAPADSGPDYSNVSDVLNGQRILVDVTDLVGNWFVNDGPRNSQITTLNTANGGVSNSAVNRLPNITCFSPGSLSYTPPLPDAFRIVRLFNNGHDAILKVTPSPAAVAPNCSGTNNMWATVQDENPNNDTTISFTLPTPVWLTSAVGDFDFDGFDDVFFIDSQSLFVVSAVDTGNGQAGVQVFNLRSHGLPATQTPQADAVTGDFNNDGLIDVAWIGAEPGNQSYATVSFATVCPGPVANTVCASATRFQTIVWPTTFTIDIGLMGFDVLTMAIAAGNFGPPPHDYVPHQLAVGAWFLDGDSIEARVRLYSFDDNLNSTLLSQQTVLNLGGYSPSSLYLRSFFDGYSGHDQLVSGLSFNDQWIQLNVITVDATSFSMTTHAPYQVHSAGYFGGMDVGIMGALPTPATDADYTPQVAGLILSSPSLAQIATFSIDAADGSYGLDWTQLYTAPDSVPPAYFYPTYFSMLRAGDLQGRSFRLGEPTVLRANQQQPVVILGAPPMHADYIEPIEAQSTPDILNLSVLPDGFNTKYDLDLTSTTTSSTTTSTSHSYAVSGGTDEQAKFGVPLVSGISVDLSQSWSHSAEATGSNGNNNSSSTSLDVASTTGLGDELWYVTYNFNDYIYPVLGQTACPSTIPDCSANEEQPLYVQFSGPDTVTHSVTNGATAEWYQPVHEPGQIFSYPWSQAILDLSAGNLLPLTDTGWFYTDDSGEWASASWTNSSGTDWTTGTTDNHSFDTSNSVTFGTPNLSEKESGVNVTGKIDYNRSSSVSTLHTGSTDVAASAGVIVTKTTDFPDPQQYQYGFAPIIAGQALPDGSDPTQLTNQTVNTTGPFRTTFLADPTIKDSGSWWSSVHDPYKCHMDVALNHPERWQAAPENANWPNSCILLTGLNTDCAKFNFPEPGPNDVWTSSFYNMRGLFVTVGAPSGPQRVTATDGDTIYLQARVYNYSLMDMDVVADTDCTHASRYPNAVVKVRFYRQPWNTENNTPIGDSVLIAETAMPPIPGFNSDGDTPNWSTTTATLDTTGLGDSYQVFWVLVWAEDGEGHMLPELLGHGLASDPASVTINTIADVPLETVNVPVDLPNQVASFSNNVAMFHQAFYVAPPDTESTAGGQPAEGELQVENVRLSPHSLRANKQVTLSADIRSVGGPSDGVTVAFFADEPKLKRSFDTENISYIGADKTYHVEVPVSVRDVRLRHEFQVVADPGRPHEARSVVVRVGGKR